MIPNRYHFVWFGRAFPFTHALAIRSLARTCAPEAIVLHVSEDLTGVAHFDAVAAEVPALSQRRLDIDQLLAGCEGFDLSALRSAYLDLLERKRWAALSDILRYLILLREGGVYLDFDIIAVRDLRPVLRSCQGFCGRERILVPACVHRGRRWTSYLRTSPLDLIRQICSRTTAGIDWWKHIEHLYPAAINGAVLGLESGHALAREALAAVPALVPALERRRPAIGPDLLQDLIDGKQRTDMKVFDVPAFYPLGPTMAVHYFRRTRNVAEVARKVVTDATYVVHWYNDDLRKQARPDDARALSTLADSQLFAYIAKRFTQASQP
jgi:hypothetical protein